MYQNIYLLWLYSDNDISVWFSRLRVLQLQDLNGGSFYPKFRRRKGNLHQRK